jgi:hypothetical protein
MKIRSTISGYHSSREERQLRQQPLILAYRTEIHAMQYAYKVTVRTQHLDLQQLGKTSSTRISNAQSTITKPFDP